MQTAEDARLLRLMRSDPAAGCAALLQQYGGLIRSIAARALPGRPQDAEECAADVVTTVWQRAETLLADGAPLRPWLIVTTRNAAIDRLRQLDRRPESPLEDEFLLPDLTAPSSSGMEDAVEQLVAAMPQPDRSIFLRKYWLLQSSKEIAAALGMEVAAVNTRLYRGRRRLRQQLENCGATQWEGTKDEQIV